MAGAIGQPCFYRGNAMEVSEGRSQRLQQCWTLWWYRTCQCSASLVLGPASFGWDQSFQGGSEAEQEAGIYPRPCSADSPSCLCWASDGRCGPGSQHVPPSNSRAAAITGDVGGRQRTGCLQAPSSLNHLLSPSVAETCSCLSCVYPSPIPFLPFPQAD